MSKFMKPEMEVIRFTEEDVIVASGEQKIIPKIEHNFAVLNGWGNDVSGDASISYYETLDGTPTTVGWSVIEVLNEHFALSDYKFKNKYGKVVSYKDLGDDEKSYKDFNGTYQLSKNSGLWEWYKQQ